MSDAPAGYKEARERWIKASVAIYEMALRFATDARARGETLAQLREQLNVIEGDDPTLEFAWSFTDPQRGTKNAA